MNLVLIGASPYSVLPCYLNDLMHAQQPPAALTLVEMNAQLLSLELALTQKLVAGRGLKTEVGGTRSPVAALAGAELVLFHAPGGDMARVAADIESLRSIQLEDAQTEALAELMAMLRAGYVVSSLCAGIKQAAPGATLLLSMPHAAEMTRLAVYHGGMKCLGIPAAHEMPQTPNRQRQRLAELLKLSAEGLHGETTPLWGAMRKGQDDPSMRVALAISGGAAVEVERLCFPWQGDIRELPARVDAKGARPSPPPQEDNEQQEEREELSAWQDLLARAMALGDRSALREAIETHPALYGTDRLLVLDLLLSMIEKQADVLPQFGGADVDR